MAATGAHAMLAPLPSTDRGDSTLNPPVIFIDVQKNRFLHCALCSCVYTNPVILITCGHTYCRRCVVPMSHDVCSKRVLRDNVSLVESFHDRQLFAGDDIGSIRCPADDTLCPVHSLVVNRAIQAQIDDLEVYCQYGMKQSKKSGEFVKDTTGCQQIIKYGDRLKHEEDCEFAWVSCDNGESECGKIRRRDLAGHAEKCKKKQFCPFKNKGCDFAGNVLSLSRHISTCVFHSEPNMDDQLHPTNTNCKQCQRFLMSHQQLENKVEVLTDRVNSLETERSTLAAQLNNCFSMLVEVRDKNVQLEEKLEKLLPRSTPPPTPSRSSNSVVSKGHRMETWIMPFQFKCIGTLRGHQRSVWCLQSWQSRLFSAGSDCVIKLWDLENLAQGCIKTTPAHEQRILTMAVGSQFLYTAGEDLSIRSWYLTDLSEHRRITDAHEKNITALLCFPYFLFSSSFTVIHIWNCFTLELVQRITGLHHWVRSLASNTTKEKLYSGSHSMINVWDATGTFGLVGEISHSYGSVHALAVTQQYIIAGTYNNNTHIYDVTSLQHLHHLTGHVGIVNVIVASPSGRFMFTGSSDSSIMVWSLEKMLPIQTLQRHDDSVNSMIVCGNLLLSASEDSEIKVFKHFRMMMGFQPAT